MAAALRNGDDDDGDDDEATNEWSEQHSIKASCALQLPCRRLPNGDVDIEAIRASGMRARVVTDF